MKTLALLISSLLATAAFAGTDVGNGGDLTECVAVAKSPLQGTYALDYLMTLGPGDLPLTPDVQVQSLDQSLKRIQRQLEQKVPALGSLFATYLANLRNFSDWTQEQIWTPSGNPLVDVNDEAFLRRLQKNCTRSTDPKVAHLIQAVIRLRKPRVTQFQVDFAAQEALKSSPLQASYLFVHEWLWDFTDDPEAVRWANRLLHSANLESFDARALEQNLSGIGISLRGYGKGRVCRRTPQVVTELERLTGKGCEQITPEDLDALVTNEGKLNLFLGRRQIESLQYGDFQGLTHLHELSLDGNHLKRFDPGVFVGLGKLATLSLAGNAISELQPGVVEGLPGLLGIDFKENPFRTLPEGLFRGCGNLQFAGFKGTGLRSVPSNIVGDCKQLMQLDLSKNKLQSLPAGVLGACTIAAELDLNDNELVAIPPGFLANCDHLYRVNLTNNRISSLPSDFFVVAKDGSCGVELYYNPVKSSFDELRAMALKAAGMGRITVNFGNGAGISEYQQFQLKQSNPPNVVLEFLNK